MEKKLTVKAGYHDRADCPVSFDLGTAPDAVRVLDARTGAEVPAQLQGSVLSWVVDDLKTAEHKDYVVSDAPAAPVQGVEIEAHETTADVRIGGEPFTTYHFGIDVARPFLNPVIGPTGVSVLRELFDTPAAPDHDHIHHRGIYVAHGMVNGVDNWSEVEGNGYVHHQAFHKTDGGSVFGRIEAENIWVSHGNEKVIAETRTMTFYNLSAVRIIDFDIVFHATQDDVVFGDTKEGGILSVRVATPLRGDRTGRIVNGCGGVSERETWGKRAPWCDYSGTLDEAVVGLAVLDHPLNFRYPTYWHVRDYGLMTANPFGLSHFYGDKTRDGSFVLLSGKDLRFRYRVFVHAGNTCQAGVCHAFHNFVNPPEIVEAN